MGIKAARGADDATTYITYGIRNSEGNIVYVGRASGKGDAGKVLAKRESSHEHKGKGKFEILDEQQSKAANRGAEDVIYNRERLKAEAEGRSLLNKQNPISDRNRKGRGYVDAYRKGE